MLHNEEIGKHLLKIYDLVSEALASGEIEQAAETLVALDGIKREIGEMHESAKNALIERMGETAEYTHEGFVFEKKSGAPRKTWDHQSLGQIVAQRLIDLSMDMDTGEMTRTPEQIARDMLIYAAPSYWRVTELNKIGVNADNYCEVGEPKASIIIRKAS
jgi:hypothetical protein